LPRAHSRRHARASGKSQGRKPLLGPLGKLDGSGAGRLTVVCQGCKQSGAVFVCSASAVSWVGARKRRRAFTNCRIRFFSYPTVTGTEIKNWVIGLTCLGASHR